MKTNNFFNRGTEQCRELLAQDPARLNYEARKDKEDAAKFRAKVQSDRVRLGLEVARA